MVKLSEAIKALALSAALASAAPQAKAEPAAALNLPELGDILEDGMDGAGCAVLIMALRRCAMLAPNRRSMALCVMEAAAAGGLDCAKTLPETLQDVGLPLLSGLH